MKTTVLVGLILLMIEVTASAQTELRAPDQQVMEMPEQVVSGHASAGQVWTLPDLEGLALANNPTLRQAAARVEAARGRAVQAGLYPNPRIGYEGTEIGNESTAGLQGGFIAQEFVRGGKLALDQSVAGQEVARAQREFDAQHLRVLSDVRIEFYNVLIAQRAMDMSESLVRVGQQGSDAAERLFKAQEVARSDVLQAQVEASSARIALDNARNRRSAAAQQLAAVVGAPHIACDQIAGDLGPFPRQLDWCSALTTLLAGSPEIAAARTNVARARFALDRAGAESISNVDVQAGVQFDNATSDAVANLQIAMPLAVFNKNQGRIREAEAQLRTAEGDVARLELAIQYRLAAVFERYANAQQQVGRYQQEILPNAKAALELVNTAYQQGEFSFLNLLTAQRTYFQTNLAYLDAIRQLWTAAAEIEGMLLSGSLNTPGQTSTE